LARLTLIEVLGNVVVTFMAKGMTGTILCYMEMLANLLIYTHLISDAFTLYGLNWNQCQPD
jgi:hypothetical protein